ncbi:MAG: hypothetical protein QM638_18955 [Nocardioides sp.]|uniref:hypothetical protein n=1 Tax=Nocardioides sp. TaxID=35761 RepID=UPI0039E63FA6
MHDLFGIGTVWDIAGAFGAGAAGGAALAAELLLIEWLRVDAKPFGRAVLQVLLVVIAPLSAVLAVILFVFAALHARTCLVWVVLGGYVFMLGWWFARWRFLTERWTLRITEWENVTRSPAVEAAGASASRAYICYNSVGYLTLAFMALFALGAGVASDRTPSVLAFLATGAVGLVITEGIRRCTPLKQAIDARDWLTTLSAVTETASREDRERALTALRRWAGAAADAMINARFGKAGVRQRAGSNAALARLCDSDVPLDQREAEALALARRIVTDDLPRTGPCTYTLGCETRTFASLAKVLLLAIPLTASCVAIAHALSEYLGH